MDYTRQYQNKINWQNTPSVSTPINETNLNKMDNALWYMDTALYTISKAIGGGSSARGGIISNVGNNAFTTHVHQRTGESLAENELLILRSDVSGTGNSINVYTDAYSAVGFELLDLDGESTSITVTMDSVVVLMITDANTDYTAQVLAVIDVNGANMFAGLGIGKMTSYTNNVIDTDIDLHREPAIGDRILLYCSSDISVSNDSIKTYNDGVAVTTDIGPILPQTIVKGLNVLQCVAVIPDGIAWNVKLNVPIVAYSAGMGIMIDNNGVISNTNPNYGENYDYKKIDSAIDDGNLGNFNGYCDNLIIDFRANAVSGGNAYTLTLVTGTTTIIRKYAVLKDRSGNPFTRDISAGMILKCESNVSGSGTAADPIVVTVLEIANWYVESGRKANTTIGAKSTAEGEYNTVSGVYGHADGYGNTASGNSASAHGIASTASGDCSVADGSYTTASGANSSAHGDSTTASGVDSTASGEGTIAGYLHQTVMGRFNENKSGNLLEVGNGSDDDARSNALEVTANGNVVAGNDIVDGNGYTLSSIVDAISEEKTVSGNPITVTDALPYNAVSLSAEIEPIQDLHGYDHPWVGGAGKNIYVGSPSFDGYYNRNLYQLASETYNGHEVIYKSEAWNGAYKEFTVKAGVTYTFSAMVKCAASANVRIFNRAAETLASQTIGTSWTKITATFTPSADTAERLRVESSTTTTIYISEYQLEYGSTATSYASYSNICPISGRTEVGVDDTGKNLLPMTVANLKLLNTGGTWDGDIYTYGNATLEILTQNGEITGFKANGTFAYNLVFKLGAPANGDLLSGCPSGGSWNSYVVYQDNSGPVDSGSGASGVLANENISIYIKQGYSANNLIFKPMVRMTGTSADYEPPKTSSVTIQLGQTVYDGNADITKGEGSSRTGKYTLNGTENVNWTLVNTDSSRQVIYANIQGVLTNPKTTGRKQASGKFSVFYYAENYAVGVAFIDANNDVWLNMTFEPNKFADSAAFKTWLASNNVEFAYELATPTTLQLTPTQLQMLKGYNRLSSDGGGDLSITYKADRLAAIEAALAELA